MIREKLNDFETIDDLKNVLAHANDWLRTIAPKHQQDTLSERASMSTGIELIAAERERQVTQEGWTADHDAEHTHDELANAAACYSMSEDQRRYFDAFAGVFIDLQKEIWPWGASWWKPSSDNRIKELVKAGALIAAEIDRLQAL